MVKGDQYKNSQFDAPFALIFDANRDGVLDVILDGPDKEKCILFGVISNKGD
jgi:hypothetical protein